MSITSLFGRAEQDLDLLVEKSREIAKWLLGPNYTAKVHIYYLNLQVNQFQILRHPCVFGVLAAVAVTRGNAQMQRAFRI